MNAVVPTSRHLASEGDLQSSYPSFEVLVLTAGEASALRAEMTLDWFREAGGGRVPIECSEWSIDHLLDPEHRALCDEAVMRAHVILVSDSDCKPLPVHLTQWLEHSLQRRGSNPPALFALYCEAEGNSARGYLCNTLRHLAGEWHASFICNKDFDTDIKFPPLQAPPLQAPTASAWT